MGCRGYSLTSPALWTPSQWADGENQCIVSPSTNTSTPRRKDLLGAGEKFHGLTKPAQGGKASERPDVGEHRATQAGAGDGCPQMCAPPWTWSAPFQPRQPVGMRQPFPVTPQDPAAGTVSRGATRNRRQFCTQPGLAMGINSNVFGGRLEVKTKLTIIVPGRMA